MDVSLVITIHDRIELYDLMKFYESKNVTPVVTMLGRGTATEKQLHLLGLEAMQKALIAGVISGKEIPDFFKDAKRIYDRHSREWDHDGCSAQKRERRKNTCLHDKSAGDE